MNEPMIELLRNLPSANPDPARAERTRVRCRTRMSAVRAAPASKRPEPLGWKMQLWQPLIAVLGCAYVAEAVVQALRTYGRP